jgi:hypothetical protein
MADAGSPHANVVQATANAAPSSELKSYFGVLCDVSMAVSLTAGKDSEQTSRRKCYSYFLSNSSMNLFMVPSSCFAIPIASDI